MILRQRTSKRRFDNSRAEAKVDFAALVLADSPNQYLVCPAELCQQAEAHRDSPVYDISAQALKEQWMRMVDKQPRVSAANADDAAMQYDFVQRSALMRFPDTITVRFIPMGEDQSTLAIYSRSKYGYSDLGVNKERIDHWLDQLENEN